MPSPTRKPRRFRVRFGPDPNPAVVSVPADNQELLQRAMALLDELRNADFMPEEFHAEHRALQTAWS